MKGLPLIQNTPSWHAKSHSMSVKYSRSALETPAKSKEHKYQDLMNFESKVMQQEFDKAERMLKKTDSLIEKYKVKGPAKK